MSPLRNRFCDEREFEITLEDTHEWKVVQMHCVQGEF